MTERRTEEDRGIGHSIKLIVSCMVINYDDNRDHQEWGTWTVEKDDLRREGPSP